MKDDTKNINCPKCGVLISIDDALTSQIEAKFSKDFEEKEKALRSSLEKESQKKLLEKEELVEKRVKDKLEKESASEKKYMQEQLAENEAKLKQARQDALDAIKEKQKFKDEKEAFALEKEKQLDEERKNIEENASKKATDAKQAEIDQLNKNLLNTQKALDEAQRKAAQGSQQTQGEVQEIILEVMLKNEFIYDDIISVAKGANGADVIQVVKNQNGVECGKIIWESKKTKAWSESWIQKLKDDQRAMKADIAVIVSSILPTGAEEISHREGVWVCDINLAISIANLLRQTLLSVYQEKTMSVGKNEKMEMLYSYLSGIEFRQRIESIVEAFQSLHGGLQKERIVQEKSWAERERQIQRVMKNTVGIYGDINGVIQLQKIEALELPEPKKSKKE